MSFYEKIWVNVIYIRKTAVLYIQPLWKIIVK